MIQPTSSPNNLLQFQLLSKRVIMTSGTQRNIGIVADNILNIGETKPSIFSFSAKALFKNSIGMDRKLFYCILNNKNLSIFML